MQLAPREESIVRSTFRALLAPRRLFPILIVSLPMVMLQWRASYREPLAAPLGALMCIAFVLAAPLAWRILFPDGLELSHGAVRLIIYVGIGVGVISFLGSFVPNWLGMKPTLLTLHSSLIVCMALFLAGGWGLGRDIVLEASLLHERARAARLEREAEHAQLLAIRAHLDPHFLFNTLNALAEWCHEDADVAEQGILQLSKILRAALLGVKNPTWPLENELGLVKNVLDLHRLRDPQLFDLVWDVPDPAPKMQVPPMLLLPLAENAVKHGPAKGHRGKLSVEVREVSGKLIICVENPGPNEGPREGSDGLPMLERRLSFAYGKHGALAIESAGEQAERTRVTISIDLDAPPIEATA